MPDTQPDLRSNRDPIVKAAKLERIAEVAMRYFAEYGYNGAKVEDIASELGISKASVFRHFESKEGLFLAAYKLAVQSLWRWDGVPSEVWEQGFFATIAYRLDRTEVWAQEMEIPHKVSLIGSYVTNLSLKLEMNRFLWSEDPYGTLEFIEYGIARGEVRQDVTPELAASVLDWLMNRFQEAMVSEELDPGLLRRARQDPKRMRLHIDEFLRVLKDAIGGLPPPRTRKTRRH